MKIRPIITSLLLLGTLPPMAEGRWITADDTTANHANTWIQLAKNVKLGKKPKEAPLKISADSKYWLWVNDSLVVFEGGLKRGPRPGEGYYDVVDIADFLKKGSNDVEILVCYFGKSGFSHESSGKSGLIVDSPIEGMSTDASWKAIVHPSYSTASCAKPNYRLSESNIRYDARQKLPERALWPMAVEIAGWGDAPFGRLTERPIPQWKDFGVKNAEFERRVGSERDTVVARLPYNLQMTPVMTLNSPEGGELVDILTDHTVAGGENNIRAQYITRPGCQTYESLGWMNGEELILILPKTVEVENLSYRETGYDAEPSGSFSSDNDFVNRFWAKALRTLYVNMRDTYFDCPDRERAQWWGDCVTMMGEQFYTYSPSTHRLMRKAIKELCSWQNADGILHSPIPGNYTSELPAQMLASIGLYGFWNYYMNTADFATLAEAYPHMKAYLANWRLDESGLTAERKGGWQWGDWGENRDIRLILAAWHYMALEAAARTAELLGLPEEAKAYRGDMARIKEAYNKCWTGLSYRHPSYHLATDDRVQALAVVSGIAGEEKYDAIAKFFETQMHASPYMEKYVMEALFLMGRGEQGMQRFEKRFGPMVDDPLHTTLYEGWGIGKEGYGGGTTNHAWSGGPLTVIARYVCGIEPLEPGFRRFRVAPDPAVFKETSIKVPTVAGDIESSFKLGDAEFVLEVSVPKGTEAEVVLPPLPFSNVTVDGKAGAPGVLQSGKHRIVAN